MKSGVKEQILAMRDNLKGGKGSASVQIGRHEYYSVNFCLIRVSKGSLSGRADTCSKRPGWPVLWLQALNCEEVQIGVDEGEDWLSCVGNLVLARVCRVTGAWLLSFPGLLKLFQWKICSLGDYFPLVVIKRMPTDTYREVDRPQTNCTEVAAKWIGAIYITTIKLLVLKKI